MKNEINQLQYSPAKEMFNRWRYILRLKAGEYEHKARENRQPVSEPSIDTVCNEMDAFLAGLESR